MPNSDIENLLKIVNKTFPIYQFLSKIKKSISWLPDEVVIKICESYLKNSHKIQKPWPWFVKTTQVCWEEWNAQENIKEGQKLKSMPIPKELLELGRNVGI